MYSARSADIKNSAGQVTRHSPHILPLEDILTHTHFTLTYHPLDVRLSLGQYNSIVILLLVCTRFPLKPCNDLYSFRWILRLISSTHAFTTILLWSGTHPFDAILTELQIKWYEIPVMMLLFASWSWIIFSLRPFECWKIVVFPILFCPFNVSNHRWIRH